MAMEYTKKLHLHNVIIKLRILVSGAFLWNAPDCEETDETGVLSTIIAVVTTQVVPNMRPGAVRLGVLSFVLIHSNTSTPGHTNYQVYVLSTMYKSFMIILYNFDILYWNINRFKDKVI